MKYPMLAHSIQAVPEPIPLDVAYEDDDLMVVNKVGEVEDGPARV